MGYISIILRTLLNTFLIKKMFLIILLPALSFNRDTVRRSDVCLIFMQRFSTILFQNLHNKKMIYTTAERFPYYLHCAFQIYTDLSSYVEQHSLFLISYISDCKTLHQIQHQTNELCSRLKPQGNKKLVCFVLENLVLTSYTFSCILNHLW